MPASGMMAGVMIPGAPVGEAALGGLGFRVWGLGFRDLGCGI